MASHIQGYDEERFASTVDRDFICSVCFSVLKDPVLCPRNHHCFCRGCITKHLENYQRCPTCADELTVETLAEPQRMVKRMLNELNIHCVYIDRGCQEILQLQHLDQHEATCGFTPAVCTNQGCGATVNLRDLVHHESEVCEFRKLRYHSCGEMTKTLANMEKRIANVEKSMTKVEEILTMETDIRERIANVEGKFEAVSNEVIGLKTALVEAFNEMKDVLIRMEDKIEENTGKVRNTPSGDRENIIVAGGSGKGSVEMFNWRRGTWSPLQSMPKKRRMATSCVYKNQVIVAGGCFGHGAIDDVIKMDNDTNPAVSRVWSDSPIKLPAKLRYHSSALYDDKLIVTGGGSTGDATSNCIYEVHLEPPYIVKTLSRMPQPRRGHSSQLFDDSLLIVGGRTTWSFKDNLSSVVLYDIKKNECKQLAPLPYEVSHMATVKWGDNIVVIGGIDKRAQALNTVIVYNIKTEQSNMLPAIRYNRYGCTAVVIRNNIVVLGGWGEEGQPKPVEAFNLDSYSWVELPEMLEERQLHSAVVV